jgi:hypothetical protein
MKDMIERFEGKLENARQELNYLSASLEMRATELGLDEGNNYFEIINLVLVVTWLINLMFSLIHLDYEKQGNRAFGGDKNLSMGGGDLPELNKSQINANKFTASRMGELAPNSGPVA